MISKERQKSLERFAEKLQITINDWQCLHQALTHTSYANEIKKNNIQHNERLEFLGDAVLELVISTYLYKHFPNLPEGELTKARASLVCETTLARRASHLQIGEYLLFGKGELITGGKMRASILADAFEAIIGAIYLDSGFAGASTYILEQLKDDLVALANGHAIHDYKTFFQEVVQKKPNHTIAYEILSETGPDHDKCFQIAVYVDNRQEGIGIGKSKKEAEQNAAHQALQKRNQIH